MIAFICPTCQYVHEIHLVDGEPCIAQNSMPLREEKYFPRPGMLSLARVLRFQCLNPDGKKVHNGDVPFFDVPEYFTRRGSDETCTTAVHD